MARKKPTKRPEFVTVNVFYDDGSQLSNRRVQTSELAGFDEAAEIREIIQRQDDEIAERSGKRRGAIKSIAVVKGR
jgi:hypothetical protein